MIRPLQLVCLAFALSFANLCVAQTTAQIDTTLARHYYKKAATFANAQQYDSALQYFEKAAQIYEKGHYQELYIDCLNRKGNVLNATGQYEAAHQILQQALALSVQHLGQNHWQTAKAYDQLGWNQFYTSKYDEALQNYTKALEIFTRLKGEKDLEVAKMHINIGNVYRRKYIPEKAIEYSLQGIDILTALGQDTSQYAAAAYNGLGATYASMEKFDKALEYHHKALPLYLTALGENHSNVAGSYFNIGNIYADLGDNATALEYYFKALRIDITLFGEKHIYVAGDYESIGICYIQKGDPEMARAYFQKSLEIAKATLGERDKHVAALYDHIGATYHQGHYEQALDYYRKSLNILKEAGVIYSPDIASVYNNLGDASLGLGHTEQALNYQKEALKVYKILADVWQSKLGETYGYMGNCYEEMQNYDKALEYYEKDLEVRFRTVGQSHPEVAYAYSNIGNVHRKAHRFSESLSAYQQALQVLFAPLDTQNTYQNPPIDQTLNPYILYEVLNAKALAFREYTEYGSGTLEDLRFSLQTYQLAANTLQETRKSLMTAASKNLLAEKSVAYFESALETAWLLYQRTGEKEYIKQAFLLAEKSKAVAMLEAMKESEAKEFANIPASVLSQERALKVDLAFYKRKLFEEQQKHPDSSDLKSYQDKIFVLKNSYDSLISIMEQEYPEYYRLKYNTTVTTVAQIQQGSLNKEDALLTYFVGDSSIYMFSINTDNTEFFRIRKDSTYDQNIATVRSVIANKSENIGEFTKSAYALYHTLLAPAEPLLQGKNIIVIPDGRLSYIPFGVLIKSLPEGKSYSFYNLPYFIKDHQIAYAYSATLWQESLKPRHQNSDIHYLAFAPTFNQKNTLSPDASDTPLLAMADGGRGSLATLEGTKEEVNAIATHFSGQFYEGATASEQLFKKYATNYDIIHLATHAIIDDEHPMNSRLLFSVEEDSIRNGSSQTGSSQDGNLYAWELYNMQLHAQMAVLSACNTGSGKLQRGEGVMSLGRAFAYAGCPSIIMSLWPAQDQATADIMVHFYLGLSEGMTKDEALQKAKLKYLETTNELFAHPFYWASFVVQGDPSPLNIQQRIFSYWWLGGGLAMVLLCIGLFFQYRK